MGQDDLTRLSEAFRRFAARECPGSSPLYEALAYSIADDTDLLALAAAARLGQPAPNMLFAAVHALLLRAPRQPLARYYASLTAAPAPAAEAFPAFRDFCLSHEAAIRDILAARVVSTNEVQRAACLLPAYSLVARRAATPLQVIEIGASMGLTLLWDQFTYDYGAAGRVVAASPKLTLTGEVRGAVARLPIPDQHPPVRFRAGLDPVPLDPGDADDRDWLRALIWPEERERAVRLDAAIAVAREHRMRVVKGDANARLASLVADCPPEGSLCIVHSFTLNQFDLAAKARFDALLRELAAERPLFRIALEWAEAAAPVLSLTRYDPDPVTERLAHCDAHGRWIEPLDS